MLTAVYGCNIALSWLGAKYVLHGAITTGQLNALFGYIMNILMALMMLSMAFVMISMSAASAKRIVEVLDETTDLPRQQNVFIVNRQIDKPDVRFILFYKIDRFFCRRKGL